MGQTRVAAAQFRRWVSAVDASWVAVDEPSVLQLGPRRDLGLLVNRGRGSGVVLSPEAAAEPIHPHTGAHRQPPAWP